MRTFQSFGIIKRVNDDDEQLISETFEDVAIYDFIF